MLKHLLIGLTFLALTIPAEPVSGADLSNVAVSATILNGGFCIIITPSTTLSFGNLDPASPVNVNTSTTIDIWCFNFPFFTPTVYLTNDDDGLHATGLNAPRMQHTAVPTEYLPYTMSITPQSASIPSWTLVTLDINATVLGTDYQGSSVIPGDYQDSVTINIIP